MKEAKEDERQPCKAAGRSSELPSLAPLKIPTSLQLLRQKTALIPKGRSALLGRGQAVIRHPSFDFQTTGCNSPLLKQSSTSRLGQRGTASKDALVDSYSYRAAVRVAASRVACGQRNILWPPTAWQAQ